MEQTNLPESWACIDCGFDTAPGVPNREQYDRAKEGDKMIINAQSEIYTVKSKVWKAAGVGAMEGCLCIGCLEKRLGRKLTPKDFQRNHPFSTLPGTPRLLSRRNG
jgi:hypothetical protein